MPCKTMQKKGLETSSISFSLQKHLLNQYNYWLLRVKSSRDSVLKSISSVNSALGMQLENEILVKLQCSETVANVSEQTLISSQVDEEIEKKDNEVEEPMVEKGILYLYINIFK